MPAKYSPHVHPFISNSFANTFAAKQYPQWVSGNLYSEGDIVMSSSSKYIATESGISGATAPSHNLGVQNDGNISWRFVESVQLSNSFQNNVFIFVGKADEWDDENTPPEPNITDIGDYETLENIIALKKITANDVRMAVERTLWASGTVYDQYDSEKNPYSTDASGYSAPFFVLTDEDHIYKCLNNNNGSESLNKPTGTSTGVINLGDGYVWKYMGSISASDVYGFLTSSFIPVEFKTYDDGSDQWDVQQTAKKKSVSTFKILSKEGTFTGTPVVSIDSENGSGCVAFGRLSITDEAEQILVTTPGEGYTPETYAVMKDDANGSGATCTPAITSGSISAVTVDTAGSGYDSGAIVIVVGDGTGATANVVLGAGDSVDSITVTTPGSGYTWAKAWILPGSAGAVGKAIMSPVNGHGSNIISELGANKAIVNAIFSTNDYFKIGAESDFRQVGIITDIKDDSGDFANQSFYIGPSHSDWSTPGSLNVMQPGSGYIIYQNNIQAITRANGQEEHVKIVMVF